MWRVETDELGLGSPGATKDWGSESKSLGAWCVTQPAKGGCGEYVFSSRMVAMQCEWSVPAVVVLTDRADACNE